MRYRQLASSSLEVAEMSLPLFAQDGVSQIVWSPLAQGVLTGKYDPDQPPPQDTRAENDAMVGWIKRPMVRPLLETVQKPKPTAAEADLTLAQVSLAWVLREPNVASAMVGASRSGQLDDNVGAIGREVEPALFGRAEAILAALPSEGS